VGKEAGRLSLIKRERQTRVEEIESPRVMKEKKRGTSVVRTRKTRPKGGARKARFAPRRKKKKKKRSGEYRAVHLGGREGRE